MVSIIVPTYNNEKTLRATLDSVLAQDFHAWECIIIDDASSDNSANIAQEYAHEDSRFKSLVLGQNGGVSQARNTVLKQASGHYIQFLDGDDLIAPSKLKIHARYLDENPDVDVVYSDYFHFSEECDFNSSGKLREEEKFSGFGQGIARRFIKGNSIRINTPLTRRTVIDELGAFHTNLTHVEDWEFWFRLALNNKCYHFLPNTEAIAAVRQRAGSLSTDTVKMRSHYFEVMQIALRSGKLNLSNRMYWWRRFEIVVIDQLFFKKAHVTFASGTSFAFRFFTLALAFVALPFYLVMKAAVKIKNSN